MAVIVDMEIPERCGLCRFATAMDCEVNCKFIKDHSVRSEACPLKSIDGLKAEFMNLYPNNCYGDPELGGRSCVFSLNKVLEIIDRYCGGKTDE